jgi:hypothetical protein
VYEERIELGEHWLVEYAEPRSIAEIASDIASPETVSD